jgi:hypothetical protein
MPLSHTPPYGRANVGYFMDDFHAGSMNTRIWSVRGSGGSVTMPDGLIAGQVLISANTNKTQEIYHASPSFSAATKSSCSIRAKLVSTASVALSVGLNALTPQNANSYAAWVFNTALGTTWRARSALASAVTTIDTGITADTNFHEFQVVIDSIAAQFFMDGNYITTITTNIPTVSLSPFAMLESNSGAKTAYVDYVEAWNERA